MILLTIFTGLMASFVFAETKTTPARQATPLKTSVQIVEPQAILPPKSLVPSDLVKLGGGNYFSKKAIVLDKKNRTLSLWEQQLNGQIQFIKAYPADFGRSQGDKFKIGDLKTPEGVYFFQTTLAGKQIDYNEYGNRAFTTNYPNFWDQKEKKTGSGIWLHAIPPTKTLNRGSRGCVVVRNAAIEELKQHISFKDTPIIIKDEIRYVTPSSNKKIHTKLLTLLKNWAQSWQNKDLKTYINYYGKDFKALNKSKSEWATYKKHLNKIYKVIQVKINHPIILTHNDEVTIKFIQNYRSDGHGDFGKKTLYLKNVGGEYKIVHEKWESMNNKTIASLYKTNKDKL